MPYSRTHSLTNLKDSATQLLIKYKSGALITQFAIIVNLSTDGMLMYYILNQSFKRHFF